MKTEIVYSTIVDPNIKKDVQNSPIWADCKHSDDMSEKTLRSGNYTAYTIKFDGLIPKQVTNIKTIK